MAVSPQSGLAPLAVTADASRSSAARGIASYRFDFGDGTVIGPTINAIAGHTYCHGGTFRLTVTVTDRFGLRSSAYVYVQVIQPVNAVSC